MYTGLFIVITFAILLCYSTSDRVSPACKPQWLQRFARRPGPIRIAGSLLMLVAWVFVVVLQGIGAGTFAMGAYLMAGLSLVVLLCPLRIVGPIGLLGTVLLALLLEIVVY